MGEVFCFPYVSVSHAAWDTGAVHGVHATYSVSNLGTVLGSLLSTPHRECERPVVLVAVPWDGALGGWPVPNVPGLPDSYVN